MNHLRQLNETTQNKQTKTNKKNNKKTKTNHNNNQKNPQKFQSINKQEVTSALQGYFLNLDYIIYKMHFAAHMQFSSDEFEELQQRLRIFFTLASMTKKIFHASLNLKATCFS